MTVAELVMEKSLVVLIMQGDQFTVHDVFASLPQISNSAIYAASVPFQQ